MEDFMLPVKVLFLDLGDTLVKKGGGARYDWVEGAKAILPQLKTHQVRMGILSNTGTLTRSELLAIMPADFDLSFFEDDLIILSNEVGVEKPHLAIFTYAIKRAAIDPKHCVFCTESLRDVLACQLVGMRAAWVLTGQVGEFANELIDSRLLPI